MIFSTRRYVLAGALLIILLGFASIVGTAPEVSKEPPSKLGGSLLRISSLSRLCFGSLSS